MRRTSGVVDGREAVAGATHRLHHRASGTQRLAQALDVHVDRALFDEDVVAPDTIEQLCAAVHALGVRHQEVQQAELGRADLGLAQIKRALIERKWLVLACIALGVAIATAITLLMTPLYRASVLIDTALLGCGVALWVMLGLNPARDVWLGAKLGLLLAFNTTIAVVAIALVFSLGTAISRHQDARSQLLALSEVMGETSRAALACS